MDVDPRTARFHQADIAALQHLAQCLVGQDAGIGMAPGRSMGFRDGDCIFGLGMPDVDRVSCSCAHTTVHGVSEEGGMTCLPVLAHSIVLWTA
jgi:hypothetical protein